MHLISPIGKLPSAKKIPGLAWLLAALYLNVIFACRAVFYLWFPSLPLRSLSQGYGIVFMCLLLIGVQRYASSRRLDLIFSAVCLRRIKMWLYLCTVFAIYGLIIGNEPTIIGKEWIVMTAMALMALFMSEDVAARIILRHLTILFYVAAPFVLFFYETPSVMVTESGAYSDFAMELSDRYMNTIGFDLRFLLSTGLALGLVGLLVKDKFIWRILQVGAFFLYHFIDIWLFKFRSTAIAMIIAIGAFVILRLIYEGRLRLKHTVLLAAIVVPVTLWFATSSDWVVFRDRFRGRDTNQDLFESRITEAGIYFNELGWRALIGRGLGGTFDVSSVLNLPAADKWSTLHFGLLVFSLKGGILLLGSFILLFAPGFRFRSRAWYADEMNLVAALILPVHVYLFILNPFFLQHDASITFVPIAFMIARFGHRQAASPYGVTRIERLRLPGTRDARIASSQD